MDIISINILLEYLYKKFAVTFVLCLMGAFLKQSTLSTKKVNKIRIADIFSPTIFSTILICAISDYLKVSFSVYTVICLLIGMWGSTLFKLFLNAEFMKRLVKIFLKNISGPLAKGAKELAEELEEEEQKEKNNEESDNKDSSKSDKSNNKEEKQSDI